jgi:hypothetical protein
MHVPPEGRSVYAFVAAQEFVQGTKPRERMPPPVRSIDLKDKVKIVRTLDWFAGGAQRHRALRENPRAKEPERASCFFEYLVYGAIPLDGQLVSR